MTETQSKLERKQLALAEALKSLGVYLPNSIETMNDDALLDLLDSFAFEHLAKGFPAINAKTKEKLRASIADILLLRDGFDMRTSNKEENKKQAEPTTDGL